MEDPGFVTNPLIMAASALIPLVIGFIWYNPKVFGTAWMKAADVTEDKMKGANMALIFGLTFVFSFFVAFVLNGMSIHINGFASLMLDHTNTPEAQELLKKVIAEHGGNFRTFKHGALHGTIAGLFFALPVLGINAMFERKGFKYIAINAGFWILCLALMGGVICQFS